MSQRLRITFAATGPLKYVAHLDTMRTWERAIRRAMLPLVYTHGFSPHARIALAAPMPVGVVGHRELMDIWLDPPVATEDAAHRLQAAMPPGLVTLSVEEVPDALPSLQSLLRAARYEIVLAPGLGAATVRERITALLATASLDWEEERGDKTRRYDLRATILDMTLREAAADGAVILDMHLSLAEGHTGRPSQVLLALGIDPDGLEIARTALELNEPAHAVTAEPTQTREPP